MDDGPEDGMDDEVLSTQLLVFTKTEGFRHASIDDGIAALMDLGSDNDFSVTETEDSADFNQENLEKYQLVVFLSTTQDVLNDEQQTVFENYIRSGGSFMGIHAATDTEYDWPWYGQLVGAYFNGHPNVQEASMMVLDRDHPATAHLSDTWMRRDEWYNFRNINPNINVLVNLDETSYSGGENGENHPIAWYHEFDGGRSFYTAGGHTAASFGEPDFRQHLLGGILYCLGRVN
ncbi:MAG: ThuA domain-containing protein [Bacteroidota bacterium]